MHTCYDLRACRRTDRPLIRVLTMFNRLTKVLKEVCFILFLCWIAFLHLVFAFVLMGLIYAFGLYWSTLWSS